MSAVVSFHFFCFFVLILKFQIFQIDQQENITELRNMQKDDHFRSQLLLLQGNRNKIFEVGETEN